MIKFENLDGFVSELYNSCSTHKEWKHLLKRNRYLCKLKAKWSGWSGNCKWSRRISKFPFNKEEIEYLNSPFIDRLTELIETYDGNVSEIFINLCATPSDLSLIKWIYKVWISDKKLFSRDCHGSGEYFSIMNRAYIYSYIEYIEKFSVVHHEINTAKQTEVMNWLLEVEPDINRDFLEYAPLKHAIDNGKYKLAKYIINYVSTSFFDPQTIPVELLWYISSFS